MNKPPVSTLDIGEAKRHPDYLELKRLADEALHRLAEAARDRRVKNRSASATGTQVGRKPYKFTTRGQADARLLDRMSSLITKAQIKSNNAEHELREAIRLAKERPNDPGAALMLRNAELRREDQAKSFRSLISDGEAAKARLGIDCLDPNYVTNTPEQRFKCRCDSCICN